MAACHHLLSKGTTGQGDDYITRGAGAAIVMIGTAVHSAIEGAAGDGKTGATRGGSGVTRQVGTGYNLGRVCGGATDIDRGSTRGIDGAAIVARATHNHIREGYIRITDDVYVGIAGNIGLVGAIPVKVTTYHLLGKVSGITSVPGKINRHVGGAGQVVGGTTFLGVKGGTGTDNGISRSGTAHAVHVNRAQRHINVDVRGTIEVGRAAMSIRAGTDDGGGHITTEDGDVAVAGEYRTAAVLVGTTHNGANGGTVHDDVGIAREMTNCTRTPGVSKVAARDELVLALFCANPGTALESGVGGAAREGGATKD